MSNVLKPDDANYAQKLKIYEKCNLYKKTPRKRGVANKPNDLKSDEAHMYKHRIYPGNLFKGSASYSHVSNQQILLNGNYYAYNGWVYLGTDGKSRAEQAYGKSAYVEAGFYDSNYLPNFNCKYPRKKIALQSHHTIPFIYQYVENNNPDSLRKSGDPEQNKMLRKLFLRNLIRQKGKKGVVGQAIPYRWEAHHVLPMSFFFRYFTPQEIELILATEYDINDGRNIIFLPKNRHSSPVHNLPYHPSDHPQYTKEVEDKFKEVRRELKEAANEDICNQKNVDNGFLEKTLHQHESEMFEYIIGLGCQQLR